MIYTVTLNPAIDYVVFLPDAMKGGGVNRSAREEYQFGGKGVNVSVMLKTLGMESTALGFVAGFTGEALAKGVADMGIKAQFLPASGGMTRINVKVKGGGEETEINGSGPVISDADTAALMAQLGALAEGDVLILSGSVPSSMPADSYARILERVKDRGVLAVVDTSGKALLDALPYRPFLIKPNNHELAAIFGCELRTDEDIIRCAKALQERGARNVLVSLAGDGSLLVTQSGETVRMGCPRGTIVNSVGAGDSMVAGFVAGYMQTGDFGHALRLGTAAGSATAFSAGLGSRALIDELLASL